ncbi:VIT domain-containing protein [Aquimarina sp. W85]|uniref:VIT domain-containing protein n=1 Tax=Aquimarina rhodophyticola TaxID=3342246 RepID=UPI00366D6949
MKFYASQFIKIVLLFVVISLLSHRGCAQGIPTLNGTDASSYPIVLSELHIEVFVVANIATTTMKMNFYNPNNRVMEGEFNFPLSNGVTISRFALDVNGEMREGVVVDKDKAVQAFEAVTRRNVDPGIAEVTKGNNFKARVYPILPNGYKKAIIAFEQEIHGDAENYLYQLPLAIKNKLKKFSVSVEVVMNKPKIVTSKYPTVTLEFTEAQNSYISKYQATDTTLDSRIAFAIPKPTQIQKALTYKGSVTSDNYFYTHLAVRPEQRNKRLPKKITLIWDVSSSAIHRDVTKEIEILSAYLNWMGGGEVELFTLSNTIHTTKTYQNTQAQRAKLISDLRSVHYDGATNLYAIDFSKVQSDEVVIFSDGISNFGEEKTMKFAAPVLAINTSNIADHTMLTYIATQSKGEYINAFDSSVAKAIDIATHHQKQFIKADFDTEKIKEVYPTIGTKVTDHFGLSGKIEGQKSEITLHFGFGQEITESIQIPIDNAQGIKHTLGERLWAQKKLQTLFLTNDVDAIKSHGKKFNLVTPNTSLIVLDAIEDYIQYEIVPPASLQNEYFTRLSARDQKNLLGKEERIARLCKDYEADYSWWQHVKHAPMVTKANKSMVNTAAAPLPPTDIQRMATMQDEQELEEVIMMNETDFEDNVSKKAEEQNNTSQKTTAIKITQWDSNATYINALKSVDRPDMYATYLTLKKDNLENPSFYFDVATYMFQKSLRAEGLRVISNLAELQLHNAEVLRTLGRKLYEFKFYNEAIAVFKEVLQSRSFEPHSYIDLGLTYAEKGAYQKAITTLYTVIDKVWDTDIISRFSDIERIVLHDINAIIAKHGKQLDASFIASCFIQPMPVDMRVVIDWDANDTDIDLWITDPTNEKCSYSNKNTRIGGRISNDITQGYGPEEFRLKNSIEGNYVIEAKFFGTSKQTVLGVVTVRAVVYTNFGTKKERKEVLTLQLEPQKGGAYTIGVITVDK